METKGFRSQGWFGKKGKDGLIYRSWIKKRGVITFKIILETQYDFTFEFQVAEFKI